MADDNVYLWKDLNKMESRYNRVFTLFQKLDKKLANWESLSPNTKDKWTKIMAQQQIEASYIQISEMKKYTRWFIGLTIVTIIATFVNIYLSLVA